MKHPVPLKLLVIALAAATAGTVSAAAEERPHMENYPSSYEFLQALQAWNKAHPNGVTTAPASAPAPVAAQAAAVDPTSEQAPPPIDIKGPENLDMAVEQAKGIEHPAYKEKIRYHRTTHLSFPLHKIDGQDLSQASVEGALSLPGKTEKEKKEALELLTSQLDQDQRRLQDKPDSGAPAVETVVTQAAPSTAVELHTPSGIRGFSNITVAGH